MLLSEKLFSKSNSKTLSLQESKCCKSPPVMSTPVKTSLTAKLLNNSIKFASEMRVTEIQSPWILKSRRFTNLSDFFTKFTQTILSRINHESFILLMIKNLFNELEGLETLKIWERKKWQQNTR